MGHWTRRVFDLCVIVGLACGLLALAWQVAPRPQTPSSTMFAADSALPDTPELQLFLPLERSGMVLSRESVPGGSQLAIDSLERKCREVLAESNLWVLSLAVSDEERQLLERIDDASPLTFDSAPGSSEPGIYPLTHPTGRMGIREPASAGAAPGRRLLCWGLIMSEGTESQTVWFVRPREKLPTSAPREGSAP